MKKFWLTYQNGRNYVKEEIVHKPARIHGTFLDFQRRVFNLSLICWKFTQLYHGLSMEVEI
jgi:hypothetical protein